MEKEKKKIQELLNSDVEQNKLFGLSLLKHSELNKATKKELYLEALKLLTSNIDTIKENQDLINKMLELHVLLED